LQPAPDSFGGSSHLPEGEADHGNRERPSSARPDPFFWLPADSEWNACVGRQGDEENYVDGYIEAAIELADAVIEKRMYGKRDTLVMPILYNARHALELLLKFAINRLHEMGVIKDAHPKNHDIMSHWAPLQASELGDEALREYVTGLKPYIASLAEIDDDGQELRYSENRAGQKSLAGRSLANIQVIRASLRSLSEVMVRLKHRLSDLAYERTTNSYTAKCSRRDLLEIAGMLPKRSEWREPKFVEAKAAVTKRFNLSGREFSKAVNVIERNREMRCLIGLQTNLAYLSDQSVLFAVEEWARLHPARTVEGPRILRARDIDWDALANDGRIALEVNSRILEALTPDQIADLEAIYYIGRDGMLCEHYERKLESTRKEHRATNDLATEVYHLIQKTNFQKAVARGVFRLGRPDLAVKLLKVGRGVAPA
jgi:hypothetical protein